MTDRTPDAAPLPTTGGSWIRDAEGRLHPAPDPVPNADDAPARPRKPRPVKEG